MRPNTNKIEINAAILEQDIHEIQSKINQVKHLVDFVQIDICDGAYVPGKTFLHDASSKDAETLFNILKDISLELDMMVDWLSPKDWVAILKIIKPQRIVLHHSSITNEILAKVFDAIDPTHTEFGLGIHLDDDIDDIVARFDAYPFNYVQIMGIEKVGFGGQAQSKKLIPYIKAFKAHKPNVPISIDGGVKLENVKTLKNTGVTRMTIGSGLFVTNDTKRQIKKLRDAVT